MLNINKARQFKINEYSVKLIVCINIYIEECRRDRSPCLFSFDDTKT